MARWRLTAWLPDQPKIKVIKHWQTDCKLCAIAKAQSLASEVASAHKRPAGSVKWTAAKLMGAIDGFVIHYHSDQRIGNLPRRHGH